MEKFESAWKNGNPLSIVPAVLKAPSYCPIEPATTLVPCRGPTAREARTPEWVDDPGVAGTVRTHRRVPFPARDSYPPWVGVVALPTPTNTVLPLDEGVESTGIPPVLTGHPGTPDPPFRWYAYTCPARSPTRTAGPPRSSVATDGEDRAIGLPAVGEGLGPHQLQGWGGGMHRGSSSGGRPDPCGGRPGQSQCQPSCDHGSESRDTCRHPGHRRWLPDHISLVTGLKEIPIYG